MAKRAAIYTRVSSEDQADGISLDMQQQRCAEWVAAQGWIVAETYHDIQSGTHAQRPQFQRLRERLGEYDAVVCWRLDRATRSNRDLCSILADCERHGAGFVSVTEGFDVGKPFGKAIAGILSIIAELESENIGARTRAAKAALVAQGQMPWRPMYGYAKNGRGVLVNEEEAAVVRRIFRERARGTRLIEIVNGLGNDGLDRRGAEWTVSAVGYALRETAYIGEPVIGQYYKAGRRWAWRPRREATTVPGLTPRIVTQGAWRMAHTRGYKGRRPSGQALFRALLDCTCDGPFYVLTRTRKHGRIVTYTCGTRKTNGTCAAPSITQDALVSLFRLAVDRVFRESLRWWIAPLDAEQVAYAVQDGQGRVERLQVAYAKGLVPLNMLEGATTKLREVERRAQYTSPELATARQSRAGAALCREAIAMHDAGETTGANELLRRGLACIEVDSNAKTIRIVMQPVTAGE